MGGDDSQKLLPWRGIRSSPGRKPPAQLTKSTISLKLAVGLSRGAPRPLGLWPQLQPAWVIFGKHRWVNSGARRSPSSWILRRITYLPTYSPQVRALPDGHQILVIGTPISQANGPGKEMYVLNVDSGKYQRVVQRGALSSWRRRR